MIFELLNAVCFKFSQQCATLSFFFSSWRMYSILKEWPSAALAEYAGCVFLGTKSPCLLGVFPPSQVQTELPKELAAHGQAGCSILLPHSLCSSPFPSVCLSCSPVWVAVWPCMIQGTVGAIGLAAKALCQSSGLMVAAELWVDSDLHAPCACLLCRSFQLWL